MKGRTAIKTQTDIIQTTLLAAISICTVLAGCNGLDADSREKGSRDANVIAPENVSADDIGGATGVTTVPPNITSGKVSADTFSGQTIEQIFSDIEFRKDQYSKKEFAYENFKECWTHTVAGLDRDIDVSTTLVAFADYVLGKYGANPNDNSDDAQMCDKMILPTEQSLFDDLGDSDGKNSVFTYEKQYYIASELGSNAIDSSTKKFLSKNDERIFRDEYIPERFGSKTIKECNDLLSSVRSFREAYDTNLQRLSQRYPETLKIVPNYCKGLTLAKINLDTRLPKVFKAFKKDVVDNVFGREFEQESVQLSNCDEYAIEGLFRRWHTHTFNNTYQNDTEAQDNLVLSGYIMLGSVIDYKEQFSLNGLQILQDRGIIRQVFPDEGSYESKTGIEKAWDLALRKINRNSRLGDALITTTEDTSDLYANEIAPWVFSFECSDDPQTITDIRYTTNSSPIVNTVPRDLIAQLQEE